MADTSLSGLAYYLASKSLEEASEEKGVLYGVLSKQAETNEDAALISSTSQKISQICGNEPTIFIAASWDNASPQAADLYLMGSSTGQYLSSILSALKDKFEERIEIAKNGPTTSFAKISSWLGMDDELKLKEALVVAVIINSPIGESIQHSQLEHTESSSFPNLPSGSRNINQILADARARFTRFTPTDTMTALIKNPTSTYLVDIRPEKQRHAEGLIPGALIIERNVLEWRLDPQSVDRIQEATSYDITWIVFCSEGYASSLAVATLLDLGLKNATDIVDGFKAWEAEGRPVTQNFAMK